MITYMGKRGGFVQATGECQQADSLDPSFIDISATTNSFLLTGTLQLMDDCVTNLAFDYVDIYSGKNMRIGKERILWQIVIPYQLRSTSRAYSVYERTS